MSQPKTEFYKRANFVTHLPANYLYSPSHYWMAREGANGWRVGFTKFATRMLGEMVDLQFEKGEGAAVTVGEIIGSIEGFKAISDIYCVVNGTFVATNLDLRANIELVSKDPYLSGWLYLVEGEPDRQCGDVESYRTLLDATIDRILEKQKAEE